jgi:hypothetical protein
MKTSELKAFLDSVLETGVDPTIQLVMEIEEGQYEDDLGEVSLVNTYKNNDLTDCTIKGVKLVGVNFKWEQEG